jgi:DNA-binding response OmpR family regulator
MPPPSTRIVDDEPGVRDSVPQLLCSQGFCALTAGRSYRALQILAEKQVDVLLVEIVTPGKTGSSSPRRSSGYAQR